MSVTRALKAIDHARELNRTMNPNKSTRVRNESEKRIRKDGKEWLYTPKNPLKPLPIVVEKPRALKDVPSEKSEQNNLATELIEWARHEEAEAIEQFPLLKAFNPYKFYDIALNNAYFADCLDAAMAAIGFRRERNARTRKEDATTIMKMQPLYNKQYRALSMEKSLAESTRVGTVIQVIESKIPESDMVPERISE